MSKVYDRAFAERPPSIHDPPALLDVEGIQRATTEIRPGFMLCVPGEQPPSGDQWIHEIKWDGYRTMAFIENRQATLIQRGRGEIEIAPLGVLLGDLKIENAIIDGEIVALDEKDRSDPGLLKEALTGRDRSRIRFVAFDLLMLNGWDLRDVGLEDRRRILRSIYPQDISNLMFSEGFYAEGVSVLQAACRLGFEGIVSKRKDSPYREGRFGGWRKTKCIFEDKFLVAGFTPYGDHRYAVGSLILGEHREGRFEIVGRAGTGFSDSDRAQLFQLLSPDQTRKAPFAEMEPDDERRAAWVRPRVEVKVRYLARTSAGRIRQGRFVGVTAGKAKKRTPAKPTVTITHGDRVVDKRSGTTKQSVADYYESVLDRLYPHLAGRAVSIVRCPDGADGKCFVQRHLGKLRLAGLKAVEIAGADAEGYLTISNPKGVLSLVQYGTFEFHPWGSLAKVPDKPDRLIFDLDPDAGVPWKSVVDAARLINERLEAMGLRTFPKLSGGKGIHIVCPILPELEWDPVKAMARALAEKLEEEFPDDFVAHMAKKDRTNKIFIDYLRNDMASTAVAPYSIRARPGLAVAMPTRWDLLDSFPSGDAVHIGDVGEDDPWEGFFKSGVSLKSKLKL